MRAQHELTVALQLWMFCRSLPVGTVKDLGWISLITSESQVQNSAFATNLAEVLVHPARKFRRFECLLAAYFLVEIEIDTKDNLSQQNDIYCLRQNPCCITSAHCMRWIDVRGER